MRVIQCPEVLDSGFAIPVFMGGGITGCPDWQATVTELVKYEGGMLDEPELVWLNPRRDNFDPSMSEEQIKWEHEHLDRSEAVIFWFPEETLCPITLFELGVQLGRARSEVFVGCHPNYSRRFDVIIQCQLENTNIEVVDSVDKLVQQVLEWDLEMREL